MVGRIGAKGRRALKRALVLLGALAVAAFAISRVESVEMRGNLVRGLVVAVALLGWWVLTAALRRALRAQRPEPLKALERSTERFDLVPLQLRRLITELQRARRSSERYEKGLGARLQSIARRRAALRGLSEPAAEAETGPVWTGGARRGEQGRGPEEIGRIVRRLEMM